MKYLKWVFNDNIMQGDKPLIINEVMTCDTWDPNNNDWDKRGGFNYTNEANALRWISRGDVLCEVITPEDAEIKKVENSKTPDGIFVANKITLMNPQMVSDELSLELYKKSNMPLKTYLESIAALAIRGCYKTSIKVIDDKVNSLNIEEAICEYKDFIKPWHKEHMDEECYKKVLSYLYGKRNISLYVPNLKDYWYEEQIEKDPLSMSYNAGYDVSYFGYHYDTGCIDFPDYKWEETFNKRIKENKYFAYIKDNDLNKFIGYVNYQLVDNRYECGVLIEYQYRGKGYGQIAIELLCEVAKKNGIKELYDTFEIDRDNTLDLFRLAGFEVVEEKTWKKFNKDVKGVIVKKILR